MFSELKLGDKLINNDIKIILKNIYKSNFFENVSVKYQIKIIITIIELPIVQNIEIKGIKAKKNKELVKKNLILKPRSSFNEYLLAAEKKSIISNLKSSGYYFAKVETYTELLDNNSVNIIHQIDLGNKGKIKKISFIGEKVFKDRKLRSIIISEEYKFWKFISGKKYLNEETISFDERLLKIFFK